MHAFLRSLAATRELAPEHVAVLKSYWESNVVKSAPVQLAAHVRHCRAKSCKKIEGKEGWTRIVFCLDPVTLPLEAEESRPRPKRKPCHHAPNDDLQMSPLPPNA